MEKWVLLTLYAVVIMPFRGAWGHGEAVFVDCVIVEAVLFAIRCAHFQFNYLW